MVQLRHRIFIRYAILQPLKSALAVIATGSSLNAIARYVSNRRLVDFRKAHSL